MMKKLILLSLLPILAFGGYVVVQATNQYEPDYDVTLGNDLSDIDIALNQYVETPNKTQKTYDITIPDTFNYVAQDAELELYVEPETLAIAVRVKDNGYVYSSYNFNDPFTGKSAAVINPMKSGVTLDLYKESTPVSVNYLDIRAIATGEQIPAATSTIETQPNGFIAHVDFNHPEIAIKFDLHVTLNNGRLQVHIPGDTIEEYNENLFDSTEQFYLLRNIVVYQYFGSTVGEDDGYILLPDGSGALITLEEDALERASFSLDVYGQDMGYLTPRFRDRSFSTKEFKRVTMPVFGIIHDASNTGFYVSIEEGENYAILNFKSGGVVNDYYKTNFSYRYRESYEQYQSRSNEDQFRISFLDDPSDYDVTVQYTFLSGTNADYVGMAKSYQADLMANNLFPSYQRNVFTETPTQVDFIGQEITIGVLRPVATTITRYEEVVDILKTFQADGYTELTTSYKTFDMGDYAYRFDTYRDLGGKRDFKDMLAFLEEQGIPFSYYLDYVRTYSAGSTRRFAQGLSKRSIYHIEPSWMFFGHNVIETKYYSGMAEDDIEALTDFGITGVTLAGLNKAIYTGWDDKVVLGTTNQANVGEMLLRYANADFAVGLYNPDQYLYPYMSTYNDAPISSSDFAVTAASVPFVQLVLGGYVDMYSPYLNFISDEEYTLLRLVEFGIYPSYILTGGSTYDVKETNSSNVYISEYNVLRNRIALYYDFINEGLTATIGKEMVDHSYIAAGVVEVVYDDGTTIVLNYNNAAVTVDATLVPAGGYVVMP